MPEETFVPLAGEGVINRSMKDGLAGHQAGRLGAAELLVVRQQLLVQVGHPRTSAELAKSRLHGCREVAADDLFVVKKKNSKLLRVAQSPGLKRRR